MIREAFELWQKRRRDVADVRERERIAQAFNARYTYRTPLIPDAPRNLPGSFYGFMPHSSGYAWMCPVCNRIHHPVADSVFSGLQYPRCCAHAEGERLYVLAGKPAP